MSVYQDDITKIFKYLMLKYETEVSQVKDPNLKLDRITMVEVSLLEYLNHHERVTQQALLDSLDFKRSKALAIIQKLIKNGFIDKEINLEDKRSMWVSLSPSGRQLLNHYHKHEKEFVNFILKDMTVNEEKAIVKFLSKINQTDYIK